MIITNNTLHPTAQVLHHISSRPRRIRLLRELLRVLRPSGTALVTVWASEQEEPHKVAKWVPIAPPTSRGTAEASPRCLDRQPSVPGNTTAQYQPSVPGQQGPALEAALGTQTPEPSGEDPEPCAMAEPNASLCCQLRQPDGAASPDGEGFPLPGSFATGDGVGPLPAENGRGAEGSDFLVPWHVPFHRVEAGGLAAELLQKHTTASRSRDRDLRGPEPSGDPDRVLGRRASIPGDPQEPRHVQDPPSSPALRGSKELACAPKSISGDSAPRQGGPAGASRGPSAQDGAPPPQGEAPRVPAVGAPRLDPAKQSVVYSRYYHLFNQGELEGLVAEVPGARLVKAYYDKSNWCVIVQRDASK